MQTQYSNVGVAGAGAMGRGIAQIAAQAGSVVAGANQFGEIGIENVRDDDA